MKLKNIVDEDFINYKLPSMFLIFPNCTFKCDIECGQPICQNSALAHEPNHEIKVLDVIHRYLTNPITHAVVAGGLEPFDTWEDLRSFCCIFRTFSKDPIIIYTGYKEEEIQEYIEFLSQLSNVIVKFGRFIPDKPHIFDKVLGVELASDNQYAKNISK